VALLDHRFRARRGMQLDCGSPSQQPSFHLHLGHCQVLCSQRISAPQRQHFSAFIDLRI
jgi:hypothetical protein